ncbi:NADH-quinone oxidoreductase subunit J family protein [Aquirufa sp. TARAVU-A1A]
MTPLMLSFLALVGITCGSALVMLWTKNILHAALAMFMTMLGLAGLYVLAYADVMAVSHLMIYVGGVLILILFGIMLTNQSSRGDKDQNNLVTEESSRVWPVLMGLAIFAGLVFILARGNFGGVEIADPNSKLSFVGISLLTEYAMPFELVGIYLLIALIGSTYIAKHHE